MESEPDNWNLELDRLYLYIHVIFFFRNQLRYKCHGYDHLMQFVCFGDYSDVIFMNYLLNKSPRQLTIAVI